MFRRLTAYIVVAVVSIALTSVFQPLSHIPSFAQGGCQTFRETGKTACGRFLTYWQTHGGLAQQGFPISNEFDEVSQTDGKTYRVQYFERAVFEYHPEFAPPNDVLLSLLGVFFLKQKYPGGDPSGGQQPPPAATQPPAPSGEQRLTGTGTQVSQPFPLKSGLAVFRSSHTNGESNFIVYLVDMSGRQLELLANEIGPADVADAIRVPANGNYMLKVSADGAWTINVTQPTGVYSPPPATQQWSGHGSQVTPLFSLKAGAARFQATHANGESNFIVYLVGSDGSHVELIANEIGPANISTIENIRQNGVFLLTVKGDGDWTVTVQQ